MPRDPFPPTFPSGEGSDLAGVVTAVGPDVSDFAVGDGVLGFSWNRSSHATDAMVPVTQVIRKPATQLAGRWFALLGRMHGVRRDALVDAGAGDTIAVSAPAGGVGSMVVQR